MNRTFVLKRIDPASAGKLIGAIYAVLGLIIGSFVSLAAALRVVRTPAADDGFIAPLFGVAAVILLPLVYGLLGLISGFIGAALFNIFSGMVGGLTLSGDTVPRT